jgi:hypothetical protein
LNTRATRMSHMLWKQDIWVKLWVEQMSHKTSHMLWKQGIWEKNGLNACHQNVTLAVKTGHLSETMGWKHEPPKCHIRCKNTYESLVAQSQKPLGALSYICFPWLGGGGGQQSVHGKQLQ